MVEVFFYWEGFMKGVKTLVNSENKMVENLMENTKVYSLLFRKKELLFLLGGKNDELHEVRFSSDEEGNFIVDIKTD